MNLSKNTYIVWIIIAAWLGVISGFLYAPPDMLAQLEYGFKGAVLFTGGACAVLWVIKKFLHGSKE